MNALLRKHADFIIKKAIQAVKPDAAVRTALAGKCFSGKTVLVAAGKAAWAMAKAAHDALSETIDSGVVITKYGHAMGEIANLKIFEAGHPVPDENSFLAAQAAIDLVSDLSENDTVLFLLSGGGSALFEKPLVSGEILQDITRQLLASGADITEINTIRKRLSKVKGGRFAEICMPAKVFSIVLSDIIGDPLDMIASGPAYPDASTSEDAIRISKKYNLDMPDEAWNLLEIETPKTLDNIETHITGSVRALCRAAESACISLGYETVVLTDEMACEAKEAGSFLASIAKTHAGKNKNLAFIAGGETVVHVTGKGKGGRNQELALSAAEGLSGLENAAIFSVGSDGTDGPTDAAGGYADGYSLAALKKMGFAPYEVLKNNDAYTALASIGGLIVTGPTGTNVNDVSVALIWADERITT
ncbi:MAG: glycerate kinase [Clostridia bacterium]|nr:glycerate kinase [Clostridia bacterium]